MKQNNMIKRQGNGVGTLVIRQTKQGNGNTSPGGEINPDKSGSNDTGEITRKMHEDFNNCKDYKITRLLRVL